MIRLLATFLVTSVTISAQSRYSDAMYRRALAIHSTSPVFVLITLRDVSGSERLVCVPADFLIGAIQKEYHLEYGGEGERRMQQIATDQPGRVFTFSVPGARENVEPSYSPAILAEVKGALDSDSASELREQMRRRPVYDKNHMDVKSLQSAFDASASPAQKLEYKKTKDAGHYAYRDAVAQVLLEHGILAGIHDIGGDLYVVETDPNQSPDPTPTPVTTAAGQPPRQL
jgi:hypothetical protein